MHEYDILTNNRPDFAGEIQIRDDRPSNEPRPNLGSDVSQPDSDHPGGDRSTQASLLRRQREQALMERAVRLILGDADFQDGEISIAIVDNPTIARLNEQYLGHTGPADVLSFVYQATPHEHKIEGEIVLGYEVAAAESDAAGWPAEHELLWYLIHGTLHLIGHDDERPEQRSAMRELEVSYLMRLGLAEREIKVR